MKMSHSGTMLQVYPHLCSLAGQSSIWLRNLALTRAQVEETIEEADRISSWQHRPLDSGLLSPPSTSPSVFFSLYLPLLCPTGLCGVMEGNRAQPPPPGHYQTHTCCLFPSGALTLACFSSLVLTQPWLMGMSHFWFLAMYADGCALRQINFFKKSVLSVCRCKSSDYMHFLCILYDLFLHRDTGVIYLSRTLLCLKTKCFAFAWSARWCAKPVVTTTLNARPTTLWWLLSDRLPWLPDIEGTSPSIWVAISSTLASSKPSISSSFPSRIPPAIQMPFIQSREEKVMAAGFLKATALEELNLATKGGKEGATSNRGYKTLMASGKRHWESCSIWIVHCKFLSSLPWFTSLCCTLFSYECSLLDSRSSELYCLFFVVKPTARKPTVNQSHKWKSGFKVTVYIKYGNRVLLEFFVIQKCFSQDNVHSSFSIIVLRRKGTARYHMVFGSEWSDFMYSLHKVMYDLPGNTHCNIPATVHKSTSEYVAARGTMSSGRWAEAAEFSYHAVTERGVFSVEQAAAWVMTRPV